MTNLNKKIQMGSMCNIIGMAVIFVLCYFITSSDFIGGCDECGAGCSIKLFIGMVFWFIHCLLGIIMFSSAKKIEKNRYVREFITVVVGSMLFLLIQIGIVFTTTLEYHTHEESSTFGYTKFNIINGLYNIGRIMFVLLLLYYIALIVMAIRSGRQMKKEDAEK